MAMKSGDNILGENLARLRQDNHLAKVEMANFIGMTWGTWNNYEKGRRIPSNAVLQKICDLFGVTLAQLKGEEPLPKKRLSAKAVEVIKRGDASQEEAEAKRKEAEEAQVRRKEAEEAEARRKEAEEAEARRKEAEEAEAKRKEAEEAQARRKEAEEAQARRKEAEEAEAKRKEAEKAESEQKSLFEIAQEVLTEGEESVEGPAPETQAQESAKQEKEPEEKPAKRKAGRPPKKAAGKAEVKAEKKAKETAEKAEEKKAAEPEDKIPNVFIQSRMGGEINVKDILERVRRDAPKAEKIYVKPEENKAYWTKGQSSGYVVLWE